jgi:phosphoribosylanthranilate isomerase
MTKIKLCGLTRTEDALAANGARPDWAGLVFDAGRHFVSDDTAEAIRKTLDADIPIVGVFANDDPSHIIALARRGIIQYVQLHGAESEDYLLALKREILCPFIRVVSVKTTEDIKEKENTAAEFLLLDHGKGGTGRAFDWNMIPPLTKPWFMAGGIGLSNLKQALAYRPYAVDISTGAETDGVKDAAKMRQLVEIVRTYRA